jgi:hypothetical protein
MNYTGEKFTDAQAAQIMAQAHAHLRQRDDEDIRRRGADRIVYKTTNNAATLVPVSEPVPAQETTTMDAQTTSWVEWIDGRIEQVGDTIFGAVGEVIASERKDFKRALDKRDREIKSLRREIKMLRDEVGLERGLAALKAEVSAARIEVTESRRLQPHYEGKLNVLEGRIEKVTKQISRLRGEQSQLDFRQRESSKRMTMTKIELTSVGEQTREVLQRLHANGFELMDEMASPSWFVS